MNEIGRDESAAAAREKAVEDKWENARSQAQAQFESVREMVEALTDWEGALRADGWEPFVDRFHVASWRNADGSTWAGSAQDVCEAHGLDPQETARQRIEEDALSVEVRSDWHLPDSEDGDAPAEYRILLCTGGPAVQIAGYLNEHGEPETARLEMQDWFLPWTEYRPMVAADHGETHVDTGAEVILLTYARQFYFGE